MKVLHISTRDIGGAGLCAVRISQALQNIGVNSQVLVQEKYSKNDSVVAYYPIYTKFLKGIDLVLRKFGCYCSERNKVMKLSKKCQKQYDAPISYCNVLLNSLVKEADVINIHWANGFIDIPSFLKKIDKPVVFTLHDEYFFYGIAHYSNDVNTNDSFERKYYKIKKESLEANKNIGIVFLSKFMYDKFKYHDFIKDRPVTIINNSVDIEKFKIYDKVKCRNDYHIPQDKFIISFMAASLDDPRKGLNDLIKAVKSLANPHVQILAIGSGGETINSDILIKVGKITDTSHIAQILSCSDVFVMPSYQEAFAQSPLEAMACGIPTIVYPCSGTDELAEYCDCIRCSDFSTTCLSDVISKVLNKKNNRDFVRSKVADKFSQKHLAKQYLNFYNYMLERNISK